MMFMVIENFCNGDALPVYRRFRDKGRQCPDGLVFIDSWVSSDLTQCFQLMECDDVSLFQRWVAVWADLVQFKVIPVNRGKDVAKALLETGDQQA
ncbi:DUF3303 domain-containing protein [Mesorhizobium sp. INR15]|uniref:DUF3303 domain-containing protein n=1 Tax=Mesorhizobium sp. INR15 TaxID=2654248 RepID=UPI001896856D|nr:DUF3303 family protein [Mesorhizobium sp. INR15]QPC92621.1 DUF3303 domain-containing protein [Mesorhizobium sp. INR15]